MSSEPSAAIQAAIKANPVAPNEDRLNKLRAVVAEVRDMERQKADVEARLKEINKGLQEAYFKTLPDLLDEARVPTITIAAEGNMPAVTATAKPYYHANIAADWEPEKRAAAFKWLDTEGHGDLIKTEVTVSFPREAREGAVRFANSIRKSEALQNQGVGVTVNENVHWSTLTSWLKEMIEKHKVIPPLETLGAQVGRIVKLKNED